MQTISRCFHLCVLVIFTTAAVAQSDSAHFKNMDAVVVTGQYSPQTLKKSVYQVRVIGQEAIVLSGASDIQQLLDTQPGFRFSNDNALGIADVKLNGMGGNNVKILLDGVPMADRYDQRVSLSQIDIHNIDHIEIVEGPMSVSYGSDAMAGVINIITKKKIEKHLTIDASAKEETVGKEYYPFSYKGVHHQNLQASFKTNKYFISIGGTHHDFDGLGGDDFGRGKSWKPKEQWYGNARLGYTKKNFNAYYRIDGLNETILSRNPINMNNYKAVDQKFATNRYTHQIQSGFRPNDRMHFNSFISYTHYNRQTKTSRHNFQTGTNEPSLPGEQDISRLNSLSFKTTMQYQWSSLVSLQPGIDFNHEKASGDRIGGAPSINDIAIFASAEIKPIPTIKVRPGFRFSTNSQYDAPVITPALNTKFELNKHWDLRLAYGFGFRAPTLRELYLTFFDANHSLIGNTNLQAERSHSFNGSLSFSPDLKSVHIKSVLSGFYNWYSNQIQLAQSLTNSEEYTYYNIEKANTAGGSLENSLSFKDWELNLGFSYLGYASEQYENKDYAKEDQRQYLWSPEVSSNIVYHFDKLKTRVGFYYKFVGKKPTFDFGTVNNQEVILLTQTASYHLADLSVSSDVHKCITLQAGVKNIFDVTNVMNTTIGSGTRTDSAPLSVAYGRSYFLGIAFHWNNK